MSSPRVALLLAEISWDVSVGEVAALVAVHETRSFTDAAARLHLSQPGLSARVVRLERAVGTQLVDRGVRPAALTAAGRSFLPHAYAILSSLVEGRQAARAPGQRRFAGSDAVSSSVASSSATSLAHRSIAVS